jgi:hypothetical protein
VLRFRYPMVLLMCLLTCKAGGQFRVYPYLQNPTRDAISVTWFSENNSPGTLSLWKKGSSAVRNFASTPVPAQDLAYSSWETATFFSGNAPAPPFKHRVRIEGLDPSSLYEYTVHQENASIASHFRTAPAGNSPVRIIFYGDSETEPESHGSLTEWIDPVSGVKRPYLVDQATGYRNNLEVIKSRRPDLVFIAGDLAECGGEQRDWDEFWENNTDSDSARSIGSCIPIMAAPGNHEYYEGPFLGGFSQPGSERAIRKYLAYFEYPGNNSPKTEQEGRYYSLKYGPATFIVLDLCNNSPDKSQDDTNFFLLGENDEGGGNAPGFSMGTLQYNWMVTALEEAQKSSLFTFVIFHHSPYSSGPHGYPPGETEGLDKQSGFPIRSLTPLFMHYGVDAVISAHDEMWERSEINGIEVLPDASQKEHKIHFFDVGTGGDGLRGPESSELNPFRRFIVHHDSPEVWQNSIFISGGKHYGHLEINIIPENEGKWVAELLPVYVCPVYDDNTKDYAGFKRELYDDIVLLRSNEASTGIFNGDNEQRKPFNYPNPIIDRTFLKFRIQEGKTLIRIYNLGGKLVRTLDVSGSQTGITEIEWDGNSDSGRRNHPGFYFFIVETASGKVCSKPMIIIK